MACISRGEEDLRAAAKMCCSDPNLNFMSVPFDWGAGFKLCLRFSPGMSDKRGTILCGAT